MLAKQEYDYLKGYNIYVKRKEKELRELILKLSERNNNKNTYKEDKMQLLEQSVLDLRTDQMRSEKHKEELREKAKYWKIKAE